MQKTLDIASVWSSICFRRGVWSLGLILEVFFLSEWSQKIQIWVTGCSWSGASKRQPEVLFCQTRQTCPRDIIFRAAINDYFHYQVISQLLFWPTMNHLADKMKNVHHNSPEPEVTSSNYLFFFLNQIITKVNNKSSSSKDFFKKFIIIWIKAKQEILII